MIRLCTNSKCVNEFQDKTYGKGIRVMNGCKHGSHIRCTNCSQEYTVSTAQAKEIKSSKKGGKK